MNLNKKAIDATYELVKETTVTMHDVNVRYADQITDIERMSTEAILDGRVTGKNAQIRDAELRGIFAPEYADLKELEEEMHDKKLTWDLALIDKEHLKLLMRFAEMEKVGEL